MIDIKIVRAQMMHDVRVPARLGVSMNNFSLDILWHYDEVARPCQMIDFAFLTSLVHDTRAQM
jgi:hypothetical protein